MLQLAKKRPGFGLLEAVIASGILVVLSSVTVGISHVVETNSSTFDTKIVSANLAESGIEAAYSIRDKNLNDNNSDTGWDYGFTHTQAATNPTESLNCVIPNIDLTASITETSLGSSCGLSVDDSQIMSNATPDLHFTNTGVTPQVINYNHMDFVREIFIQPDPANGDVYQIRSIVFLKPDSAGDNINILSDVSTQLTNWKDPDSTPRSSS